MNKQAFYGWTCCGLSQLNLLIHANGEATSTVIYGVLIAMSAASAAFALRKPKDEPK